MFIEINDGVVVNTEQILFVYKDEDEEGGGIRFANCDQDLRVEGKDNLNALLTNLYVRKLSRSIIDRTKRIARETAEYSEKYHTNPDAL